MQFCYIRDFFQRGCTPCPPPVVVFVRFVQDLFKEYIPGVLPDYSPPHQRQRSGDSEYPLCMKTNRNGGPILVDQDSFEYRPYNRLDISDHQKDKLVNWRCRRDKICNAAAVTLGPDYLIIKKRNHHTCIDSSLEFSAL